MLVRGTGVGKREREEHEISRCRGEFVAYFSFYAFIFIVIFCGHFVDIPLLHKL